MNKLFTLTVITIATGNFMCVYATGNSMFPQTFHESELCLEKSSDFFGPHITNFSTACLCGQGRRINTCTHACTIAHTHTHSYLELVHLVLSLQGNLKLQWLVLLYLSQTQFRHLQGTNIRHRLSSSAITLKITSYLKITSASSPPHT